MTQLAIEYHDLESLSRTLGCNREEAAGILLTGGLQRCNFGGYGDPSYLRRDLDRLAAEIALLQESGGALPVWEGAKAVRANAGKAIDPGEIEMIPRVGDEHDDDVADDGEDDSPMD